MPKNYLITGLPRSGTTLLTSLLSENMEAVTFSEPEWLKEVRANSNNCKKFSEELDEKLENLRNDIKQGKPVPIKVSRFNQGLPQNYYHRNNQGEILTDKKESPVIFPENYAEKPFIIKSNAQFTACLDELVRHENYKIICMMRNPISVIMSWRSLDLPVSRGNMKVAEKYYKSFVNEIESDSLLHKQVLMANWFFKQYTAYQDVVSIIKYETLIENPQKTLGKLISNVKFKCPKLQSKNKNKYYNQEELDNIQEMIKNSGDSIKYFYPI